jgi:hypothetical protein
MLCLLVCFLLSHSSFPLMHQHLTHCMLMGDAGMCFFSPGPCGTSHTGSMFTHKLLWPCPDRHVIECAPQGTHSPSDPGGEGSQDCPWSLKLSSLIACCLFPVAAMHLHRSPSHLLPSICCLSNSRDLVATWPRKHSNNARPQPWWLSPQPILHQC